MARLETAGQVPDRHPRAAFHRGRLHCLLDDQAHRVTAGGHDHEAGRARLLRPAQGLGERQVGRDRDGAAGQRAGGHPREPLLDDGVLQRLGRARPR